MIEWLFAFLVFYLLYKLVFDFIVPVLKASAHIKTRVNQMNTQQQSYNQQQRNYTSNQEASNQHQAKPSKEDYIDFEEVK